MKYLAFSAALLAICSSAVLAQDSDQREEQQAVTATNAAQSEDDELEEEEPGQEIVCRTERVTGSLTRRRRTCMTRDEWTALEARTRDDMIRAGRQASGGQCVPVDMSGRC